MVDRLFAEPSLAALYDAFCPWQQRGDFSFYLPLVMAANSVLDVGCGTGELLRLARQNGHSGRLTGLDPADGMLQQARVRSDIDWIHGDLTTVSWDGEFELIVMTGHAFQVLVSDSELRTSLAAISSAITQNGRFGFETRNPLVKEWQRWIPDNAVEVVDDTGTMVSMAHQVETPVVGDIVRFTATFTSPSWEHAEISHSTLRFLDAASLARFLSEAGLTIDEQFGDWGREPLTPTSPEIITLAKRS